MKTKIFLLFTFLLVGSYVWAGFIPVNEAKQVAENFYFEKSDFIRSQITFDDAIIVKSAKEDIFYYVFNLSKGDGFIIVSAEDTYKPIIAYSLNNIFSLQNQPEHVKSWMAIYEKQINYLRKNEIKADSDVIELWKKYNVKETDFLAEREVKSVDPLTGDITWNQSGGTSEGWTDGWDGFVPEGTPTGCVATAMSIIMYYWQYPIQGSGTHSYYDYPYGTFFANFGETTYMWANMLDEDPTYYSALLQYHAGISVDMEYDPDGSGAQSTDVKGALISYFNYSSTVDYEARAGYNNTQWISILKTDIDNNRPLYYSGYDNDGGGHAFVCDGYDNSDYFHFNFGWGGYSNGYYNLSDVGGFTGGNAVVRNITPGDSYFPYQPSVTNFTATHDITNVNNFEVDLQWDSPTKNGSKDLTGYDIYRGEELLEENYLSGATSYTDDELTMGISDYYSVRALYSDGTSLCMSDFVKGTFNINFIINDAETQANILNAIVTFNGETKTTGYTGIDFNNVPFGQDYSYLIQHDDYESDVSGVIPFVSGDETYTFYLGTNVIRQIDENLISIYPNPVQGVLNINTQTIDKDFNIAIFDISGKLIDTKLISAKQSSVDVRNLAKGLYLIKINIDDKNVIKTFIIE